MFLRSRLFTWPNIFNAKKNVDMVTGCILSRRNYAKGDDCQKAYVDLPPKKDPVCDVCNRRGKRKGGILHKIRMRFVEGGSNFGTPFGRMKCAEPVCVKKVEEPKQLVVREKKVLPMPKPLTGVQVAILGAETSVGQFVALLLKQCSCIKKIRLYEASCSQGCTRDLCSVVQDLQHINTSCRVQAFSFASCELDRCLQNSDIVLMLESNQLSGCMPLEQRFNYQAPIVKCYADSIAHECPKAFVIVCATPIDCMVPLIAEIMKETGWYNPRKLLGSVAVPEMRASTLAARALSLEPQYTRVVCVAGTEGETLVPLFSRAIDYFDFAQHNAELMTEAVRNAASAVSRYECPCARAADLSEAHALSRLVTNVAHAILCHDIPRVTGFVESDLGEVLSPAKFIACPVELSRTGIIKNLGLPKMSDYETTNVNLALDDLKHRYKMAMDWYKKYNSSTSSLDACQFHWFTPKSFEKIDDCAYASL